MIKVTKDQPGMAVCTKFDGDDYEGCSLCDGPHTEHRPEECWWTGAIVATPGGFGEFVEHNGELITVEMDYRYLVRFPAKNCLVKDVR